MIHSIKPINTLSRDERRALAEAAADNGEQLHDACPAGLSADQRNEFHSAYVERRHALVGAQVCGQGVEDLQPV
ncbi:hypothetical protein [Polaromonas sp.]|uniref:hypothetical protein n=1 Tax=Polaromonas sp. TaxID=1869339 RepID=UPI00375081E5